MKLVIDIDEDTYNDIMNWSEFNVINIGLKLREIAQNGTLLPKGHGDLIDKNKLIYKLKNSYLDTFGTERVMSVLSELPIIIEADKGE